MEQKPPRRLSLTRPVLWVMLLGAFAAGIMIDRGLLLLTGDLRYDPGRPVYATDPRTGKALTRLRDLVGSIAERAIDSGDAESVSVYYQDIASGSWFGIDEDAPFTPPNLVKLPVMLAWLKRAETEPAVLKQPLLFRLPAGTTRRVTATKRLVQGRSYAVEDLLYRMVVYDDEESFAVLSGALPSGALAGVYRALDIASAADNDEDMLTLEQYARFFRALSGVGYLNPALSEKALSYLSRTAFRNGIIAGVPPNVPIASRFGIRNVPATQPEDEQFDEDGFEGTAAGGDQADQVQYHEFSRISLSERPYLLGVMIRGTDLDRLTRTVRDISQTVYSEFARIEEKAP